MLSIRRYLPEPGLKDHLTSLYVIEAAQALDQPLSDTLLPEMPNVRLLLSGAWRYRWYDGTEPAVTPATVTGFTTMPLAFELSGRFCIFGIGLTARGWQELFGIPASAAVNTVIDLAELCDADLLARWQDQALAAKDDAALLVAAQSFCHRLLARRQAAAALPACRLERCIGQGHGLTVTVLARLFDVSPRQLERWTAQLFGSSPVMLLRKSRFQRAMARLRQSASADIQDAIELDYFDQSHFIREFKRFTGVTPGAYFARRQTLWMPAQRTNDLLRARGAAVCGLVDQGSNLQLVEPRA